MKLSIFISTLSAAVVMASPGTGSLKRAFKEVRQEVKDVATPTTADPSGTVQIACVECPCDGFSGDCACVYQGCCCDWTIPGMPPATGWRAGPRE